MEKKEIIELTIKLYKLTLLFPKKEPLRYKARESADELLNNIISWEVIHRSNPVKFFAVDKSKKEEIIFEIEKNLEILKSYFGIAKWQNWVSYFDVLKIEEEYDKVKSDFKKEIEFLEIEKKELEVEHIAQPQENDRGPVSISLSPPVDNIENQELDERKKEILKFLKEKEKVQVWQVKETFPQISKRTLRRDLDRKSVV